MSWGISRVGFVPEGFMNQLLKSRLSATDFRRFPVTGKPVYQELAELPNECFKILARNLRPVSFFSLRHVIFARGPTESIPNAPSASNNRERRKLENT
jgi:hypothetical protein